MNDSTYKQNYFSYDPEKVDFFLDNSILNGSSNGYQKSENTNTNSDNQTNENTDQNTNEENETYIIDDGFMIRINEIQSNQD